MAVKASFILTEAQKAARLSEIKVLLKDLLKVIKVVSLYPEGNPLPQSMRSGFAERLARHVEEYGEARILVGRDTLTCDGLTVYIDKTKEEALAALFFDTGITSFTFMESFDVENIYKLLDVIKAYINSPDKSQDLANLFWESGISRFSFTTLEDIALAEYQGEFNIVELGGGGGNDGAARAVFGDDGVEPYTAIFNQSSDPDSDSSEKNPGAEGKISFRGGRRTPGATADHQFYALNTGQSANPLTDGTDIDEISFHAAEAASAMGLTEAPAHSAPRTNTTLILNDELKLSEEDEREVGKISSRDADFDLWESSLELCKEILHQESELADFAETVGICSKVATEFLRSGKLWHAGQLVQYLMFLEGQIRPDRRLWADKLADARQTFGSRERMAVLAESLNLHPEIGADELRRYLNIFGWEALSAVTDLLGELQDNAHREAVCDYLTTAGRKHLQILARGVSDKRPQAVRGAIIVLARIGDAQAFGILEKAAANTDRSVRLELVTQLKDCPGPEALSILKMAVTDTDAEIRQTAISSITAQRGMAAFNTVAEIIADRSFVTLDDRDRQIILNAYSLLGGGEAVPLLAKYIRRLNPPHHPMLSSLRQASFEALCHNRSERAERLLVQLANSWRPDVRRRAQAALTRRRQIIFGGAGE